MASTVPLCEQLGLNAPAHFDEEKQEYILDYPFPCQYDAIEKRWAFDEGPISWDVVFDRWKARGTMNEIYVESVQRSRMDVGRWLNGKAMA
jgi:ring-1,2-phenylacetyl-CoA epoxidase subunit PaaA